MAEIRKLLAIAMRPQYWPALLRKVAPTVEHQVALSRFQFATVIDVGANKGQFAYFASRQWPNAVLHCFEPLSGPRRKLQALLGTRAEYHACALGAQAGVAEMHVASREDSSSLLPLAERQKQLFKMDEVGRIEVPVKRLDDVVASKLARPALLKIDVQGFEHEVLEGASATLAQVDVVYIEASFAELYSGQKLAPDIASFLVAAGFRQAGSYNEARDDAGKLVQADLLFIRI